MPASEAALAHQSPLSWQPPLVAFYGAHEGSSAPIPIAGRPRIRLLLLPGPPSRRSAGAGVAQKGARRRVTRFLIADDSATVRLTVREWLDAAGYQVLEAADGQRTLDVLRASAEPLAVLLDYEMPELTGYEVLQRALAEGLSPPRYVYALISGLQSSFPPAFTDLLRELAIQILPKPFDRESLEMLAAYLATRQRAPAT